MKESKMGRNKRQAQREQSQAGFTLIEVLVAASIGLFLVAAAVTMYVQQNTMLYVTQMELERDRAASSAMDLLGMDLRHAGLGVGYSSDDVFQGLRLGAFTVNGGATFHSRENPMTLRGTTETFGVTTDDIGIRSANGAIRTIARFSRADAEICAGSGFQPGEIVTFQSDDLSVFRTAQIGSLAPSACSLGECIEGCELITWTPDATYLSDPTADSYNFTTGEVVGNFRELVWFVVEDGQRGVLRRAEIASTNGCVARDDSCGQVVMRDVETLQVSIFQWSTATNDWVDVTGEAQIEGPGRVRVDVEMVARMEGGIATMPRAPIALRNEPGNCVPDCANGDQVPRRAFRTSVEVRNSGRSLAQLVRRGE